MPSLPAGSDFQQDAALRSGTGNERRRSRLQIATHSAGDGHANQTRGPGDERSRQLEEGLTAVRAIEF